MVTTAALLLFFSPFIVLPVASEDAQIVTPAIAPPGPVMSPGAVPPPASPANTWTGCVDPMKGYQPVTIGKPTTICLVLANDGDWSTEIEYMRLNFQPIADVYSRFHVPESFGQLVGIPDALADTFTGNITVHAESQTALSFQKLYYDGNNNKIFPFLTAIVTVNEGIVTGITWDNACVFCSKNECQDNTYDFNGDMATEEEAQQPVGACSIAVNECKNSDKAECDLLLYVVWTGTDSNGRDFKSSANRFSAFPKQSWSDRLNLGLPNWMNDFNPFGDDTSDQTSN